MNIRFKVGDKVEIKIKSEKQLAAAREISLPIKCHGLICTVCRVDTDAFKRYNSIVYEVCESSDEEITWYVPENCLLRYLDSVDREVRKIHRWLKNYLNKEDRSKLLHDFEKKFIHHSPECL